MHCNSSPFLPSGNLGTGIASVVYEKKLGYEKIHHGVRQSSHNTKAVVHPS